MKALAPDLLICLLDNVEVVHHRLHAEHTVDATLKDLMVWREEEIMVTQIMAQALGKAGSFYVLSRGRQTQTTETCYRLIGQPRNAQGLSLVPHDARGPDARRPGGDRTPFGPN